MRFDAALVRDLQLVVGTQLSDEREDRRTAGSKPLTRDSERELGRHLVHGAVERHHSGVVETGGAPWSVVELDALERAVMARTFGAGQLQELLEDPNVENIDINGCDRVFVSWAGGERRRVDAVAESDEELVEQIQILAAHAGLAPRPFDPSNPQLDLSLPDGARLSAAMSVSRRPTVSIRRSRFSGARLVDMAANDTISPEVCSFLAAAVRARLNVMIAGATNSGKTTLLRAMAHECDPDERLITVERALEVSLGSDEVAHPNVVEFEERLSSGDGTGAVTMAELVRRSLRMNPSRVIVGEVLGDEVVTMLNAMSQGNDGSLSTIHANSAKNALRRVATYAAQAPERLPTVATNLLIEGALDLVVFVHQDHDLEEEQRADGGPVQCRRVREIRHVGESTEHGVHTNLLYAADETGTAVATATMMPDDIRDRLRRAGWRGQPVMAP